MKTGWFNCKNPIPDQFNWEYKEGEYSIDVLMESNQRKRGIFYRTNQGVECAFAPFNSYKKALECLKTLFEKIELIKE